MMVSALDYGEELSLEEYRSMVRSAPANIPENVRIRIRFVDSIECKREYEKTRNEIIKACAEVGFCPPVRFYKPKKCIMFRAEAVHGEKFIPVGYLLLIVDTRWNGFIYDVYVARPWRGLGIGTALVRAAVLLVKAKRGNRIKALVLDKEVAARVQAYGIDYNPRACRRILEKNGFIDRESGYYVLDVRKLAEKEKKEKLETVQEA